MKRSVYSTLKFRSPLLEEVPPPRRAGRAARILVRGLIVGVPAALLLLLVLLLVTEAGGPDGPFRLLFWLHDQVYLRFKGYAYTLFHPTSLVWWTIAITLFLLWLVAYLSDTSPVLRPHIWLLKRAVNVPVLYPFLIKGTAFIRLLSRLGVAPRLLYAVVQRELEPALDTFRRTGERQAGEKAARLTDLFIRLRLCHRPTQEEYLQAATDWHLLFLCAEFFHHDTIERRLYQSLRLLIQPLVQLSPSQITGLAEGGGSFEPDRLLLELLSQAHLASERMVVSQLPEQLAVSLLSPAALTQANEDRRELLQKVLALLERELIRESRGPTGIELPPSLNDILLLPGNQALRPLIGQLVAGLSVSNARLTLQPADPHAYLEVAQALTLALQLAPPHLRQPLTGYEELLGGPRPAAYSQFAAHIQEQALAEREEAWRNLQTRERVLEAQDFQGARHVLAPHYLAAGVHPPPLQPNNRALTLQPATNFGAERRVEHHLRGKSIQMRLRHRLDPVLVTSLMVALFSFSLFVFFAVQTGDRYHLFEAPLVRDLEDERILTNVYDRLPEARFYDAVYHPPDERMYLSQQGGAIHRYHPATGLWATELPFAGSPLIHNEFVMLRSGCGVNPLSTETAPCAEPESLWAVTAEGGLIRRTSRGWEIVVSDTAFRGASGRLIENEDLSTAAVSEDGRWLVAGTHDEGIGVYDLRTRQWVSLAPGVFEQLPSLQISHLVWWKERFWIAGPGGLAALLVRPDGVDLAAVESVEAPVLDLDADEESLWVLAVRECVSSGDECLWLGRLDRPEDAPQTLFFQRNRYPDLDLTALQFAEYREERLALAGAAGIYLYDSVLHSWERPFSGEVWGFLPLPDGPGFYFAFDEGLGRYVAEEVKTWEVPEGRVKQLLYGADGNVLALTEQGNLFALVEEEEVVPVFEGTSTAIDPTTFALAVALEERILFVGPEGGLIHDTRARHYQDLPADLIPEWLSSPESRLVSTARTVYALSPNSSGQIVVRALPAARLASVDYFTGGDIDTAEQMTAPGPFQSVWVWNQTELGALAGDGRVYRFTSDGREAETGASVDGLDGLPIRDATALGQSLVLAFPGQLAQYDSQNRSLSVRQTEAEIMRVEAYNDRLLLLTEGGQLWQDDRANPGLIGDEQGFAIDEAALSDVLRDGDDLYLAGAGQVEQYDSNQRAIPRRWDLPGSNGPVDLKMVLGDQPLALSSAQLFLGDRQIDAEAEPVLSLTLDDEYVWTVRDAGGHRYLKGYPADSLPSTSNAICLFRTPSPGAIGAILDARPLSNGLVAVNTEVGLRFYWPAARSWFDASPALPAAAGRVYKVEDHLAVVTPNGAQAHVALIPLASVSLPNSCATGPVNMELAVDQTVRMAAVDEQLGQAAWVTTDGAVAHWRDGAARQLLPPPTVGPSSAEMRRLYGRRDHLLVTTDSRIWHYDLEQRRWSRIDLDFVIEPAAAIADVNLEQDGDRETVLVSSTDGAYYLGQFAAGDERVEMRRIYAPSEGLGAAASSLIDVQAVGDGRWAFVLDEGVRYYDPASRDWEQALLLPEPDPSLSFRVVFDRKVAVGDRGRVWHVADNTGAAPQRFVTYTLQAGDTTYLDGEGTVWRLTSGGQLLRCTLSTRYSCVMGAPSPFLVEAENVRRAFVWDSLVFFEERSGFRAFNTQSYEEVTVPQAMAEIAVGGELRQMGDRLWLFRAPQLLLMEQEAGGIQVRLFDDVSRFVYDQDGQPWAKFGQQWQVWGGTDWLLPTAPEAVSPIRLFPVEGAQVIGLDERGYFYWWNGTALVQDAHPLRYLPDLPAITAAFRGPNQDWWLLSDGQAVYIRRTLCATSGGEATPTSIPTSTTAAITATRPFTGTPTVTATVSSPATPTAMPVPCLDNMATINLGRQLGDLNRLSYATVETLGALSLTGNNDVTVRIEPNGPNQFRPQVLSSATPPVRGLLPDLWPSLADEVLPLPNGRSAFRPLTELATNGQGELVARRLPDELVLAAQGANTFTVPAPLDAGWLRWNRDERAFDVASPSGRNTFDPEAFIADGRLLFEPVAAVLAIRPDLLYAANAHGIWTYREANLSLDGADIRFQPLPLPGLIQAAHGRFLSSSGDAVPGDPGLQPATARFEVRFGDVTLHEVPRSRRVEGTARALPTPFSEDGFLWDSGRRGVAFAGDTLLLQSNAGLHPVDDLSNFDVGPGGLARSQGVLFHEDGPYLYESGEEEWYHFTQGEWERNVGDPRRSRLLLDDSHWAWQWQDGQFRVLLKGENFEFDYPRPENGFRFSHDWLQAAASHEGKLHVVTAAFQEVADDVTALSRFEATRLPVVEASRLENYPLPDGEQILVRYAGSEQYRWQQSEQRWQPIRADTEPGRNRLLAETSRMRFRLDDGAVRKELYVDEPSAWTPFHFTNRQFPFDVVTAVAAVDDILYVGSQAGLQLYEGALTTGLDDLDFLYAMGDVDSGLEAVVRLGHPVSQPDLFMAQSTSLCIERRALDPFTRCDNPALLDDRLRVHNSFWLWTETSAGITGSYRNDQGQYVSASVTINGGRFRHDRLSDATVCNDTAVTLWDTGWVTVHDGSRLSLSGSPTNFPLSGMQAQRLICIEKDILLKSATIARALYLEGSDGDRPALWRYDRGSWQAVTDVALLAGVLERADRPPIFERQQLRLRVPIGTQVDDIENTSSFQFEQRTLGGDWQPLAWTEGRVAVDHWRQIVLVGERLWVATATGLIPVEQAGRQEVWLDTDDFLVVREPREGENLCHVTDLRSGDGAEVLLRCSANSSDVYRGNLDGRRDQGVFSLLSGDDPFSSQTYVTPAQSDIWQVEMIGQVGGRRGLLTVERRGEPVQVVGGSFDFDTLGSLALFGEKIQVAATEAGWFQVPADGWPLSQWQRPEGIAGSFEEVAEVILTWVGGDDGAPILCLRRLTGGYERLTPDGYMESSDQCPHYLGRDSLWLYMQDGSQLLATAPASVGGQANRLMQLGRFNDDRVVGLPLTARDLESEDPYYLVPTAAGVVRMDRTYQRSLLYAPPYPGLPGSPLTLALWDEEQPVYAAQDGFHSLNSPRSVLAPIAAPAGQLQRIEGGYANSFLRWTNGAQQHWSLLAPLPLPTDTFLLELDRYEKYTANRDRWNAAPWMTVALEEKTLHFFAEGVSPAKVGLPGDFDLVVPVLFEDHLLLVGSGSLLDVNLEQGMVELFE